MKIELTIEEFNELLKREIIITPDVIDSIVRKVKKEIK